MASTAGWAGKAEEVKLAAIQGGSGTVGSREMGTSWRWRVYPECSSHWKLLAFHVERTESPKVDAVSTGCTFSPYWSPQASSLGMLSMWATELRIHKELWTAQTARREEMMDSRWLCKKQNQQLWWNEDLKIGPAFWWFLPKQEEDLRTPTSPPDNCSLRGDCKTVIPSSFRVLGDKGIDILLKSQLASMKGQTDYIDYI